MSQSSQKKTRAMVVQSGEDGEKAFMCVKVGEHIGKAGRIFDVFNLIFNVKYQSDHIPDGYSISIRHTAI